MKTKQLFTTLLVLVAFLLPQVTFAQQPKAGAFDWPYKIQNGTIVTNVPDRQPGQQSVLGLVTPKLDVVRVAFVGLGMRGPGAVERWTHIPGIQIMALCDYEQKRAEACQQYLRNASMPPADIYSGENGYLELCKRQDIDVVYMITTLNSGTTKEIMLSNGTSFVGPKLFNKENKLIIDGKSYTPDDIQEIRFEKRTIDAIVTVESQVDMRNKDNAVYNLNGQKVCDIETFESQRASLPKGIYVINGKKFIKK